MNNRTCVCGLLAISVTALTSAWVMAVPPERTLPVDPVELIAGREVAGQENLIVERDGIAYRFATQENKAQFEKEPGKYEVADGGACGRMGPLAGTGDARRYAVHERRIYFFASDGCRAGFLKDPGKYIETGDDKVFGSNEQVTRGRAALDRVVAWAGGAARIQGLTTYRASSARKETQGGTDYAVTNETSIAFPERWFQRESWNESWFSTVSGPDGSAFLSAKTCEHIAPSRARAFARSMARWPIVILKAHVDGSPKADCPGLIVIGDGEGTLGATPVEFVKVWLNGAASRLTIEKATGKLVQLTFRGRDNTMKIGDSVRTFTTFATVDGITLPTGYTVVFDGKELAASAAKIDAFEVNPTFPPEKFKTTARHAD